MDEQRQDDQLEPTHSHSVLIKGVSLKTLRKQLTIEKGGERERERERVRDICANGVTW